MKTMKAAVAGGSGKLEVVSVPVPEPGPYEVLCEMCFGATCAGTDIHLMDGLHPYPVYFPTVLGHESVGRVVAVGNKVRTYKLGDLISRVGCPAIPECGISSNWGGFAEYGIAKDHRTMSEDGIPRAEWDKSRVNQVIDPGIDEKTAPMIITWRETLSYIRRLGVSDGDRVLVIGSGGNALSLAAHACNTGAEVIAVGSSKRKDTFGRLNLSEYCDYKDGAALERLALPENRPFDYIIDGVGSSGTLNKLIGNLRKGGTIGVYGWNDRYNYGINPFSAKSGFRVYVDGYDEEESNEEVQKMILEGRLSADLWYDMDNPVPLTEITCAYDSLRRHEAIKYLIDLRGGKGNE